MALREVAELVGDNRAELVLVERLHERQTDDEVVALPAERAEPWDLHDAGVQLSVEEERVHLRPLHRFAQLVERAPERFRVLPRQADAFRRRDPHPERAQDEQYERAERDEELEDRDRADDREPDHSCRGGDQEREHHDHVGVAEPGEEADATAVAGRLGAREAVEPFDETLPLFPRHAPGSIAPSGPVR